MSGRKRRGLLCARCRLRKVRCDNGMPCSGCAKEGTECVRISQDKRKERYSQTYVEELHSKIEGLEEVLANVQTALNDRSASVTPAVTAREEESTGDRGVYGATLVFVTDMTASELVALEQDQHHIIEELNSEEDVVAAIKLFFRWQYPGHNMYVYRETFLEEFLNPKPGMMYCSRELVYALAAMGALQDPRLRTLLMGYYNQARTTLLGGGRHGFDHPLLALMQALLALLFYDVCHGNNSLAWMLAGMGVRMGFDLGFHLHPKLWYIGLKEKFNPKMALVRSRVFWGCFVADHFMSLILGRPTQLKFSDATLPQPLDQVEPNGFKEYSFSETPIQSPMRRWIELIDLCNQAIDDIFALGLSKQELEIRFPAKVETLKAFNKLVAHWKTTLPLELQWTRESFYSGADDPTKVSIRFYYYMVILCMNRPFLEIVGNSADSPRQVLTEAIEDLLMHIQRFKEVHLLQKASIHLVYACILSVSVLTLNKGARDLQNEGRIELFLAYLQECSHLWQLAAKAHDMIKRKLSKTNADATDDFHSVLLNDDNFFAGPPVLMTADFLTNDWESMFPYYEDNTGNSAPPENMPQPVLPPPQTLHHSSFHQISSHMIPPPLQGILPQPPSHLPLPHPPRANSNGLPRGL